MHDIYMQAKDIILSVTSAPFLEEEFRLELALFANLPWHALGVDEDYKTEFFSCRTIPIQVTR
jgi:hypothetical protein